MHWIPWSRKCYCGSLCGVNTSCVCLLDSNPSQIQGSTDLCCRGNGFNCYLFCSFEHVTYPLRGVRIKGIPFLLQHNLYCRALVKMVFCSLQNVMFLRKVEIKIRLAVFDPSPPFPSTLKLFATEIRRLTGALPARLLKTCCRWLPPKKYTQYLF